jgi:hypothetical protein
MIASGPFWISIFFLLSGYVCAIKPLRLSAQGQQDEARRVIASSAFRRIVRIGIPAFLGTMLPWMLTQMGAFTLIPELKTHGGWLSYTTPHRVEGVFAPVKSLVKEAVSSPIKVGLTDSLIHGRKAVMRMKRINGRWDGKCEGRCWCFWCWA